VLQFGEPFFKFANVGLLNCHFFLHLWRLSDQVHLRVVLRVFDLFLSVLLALLDLGQYFVAAELLELVLLVLDVLPELEDLSDQVRVSLHVCLVILKMKSCFFLNAGCKRVTHRLEEPQLSLVFSLNLFVHFLLLKVLIFNILKHLLLDRPLQLIEIIDILSHPVDSIFERADVYCVRVDLDFGAVNHLLHLLLADAETVNQVAELGVGFVEFSELFVHFVCVVF